MALFKKANALTSATKTNPEAGVCIWQGIARNTSLSTIHLPWMFLYVSETPKQNGLPHSADQSMLEALPGLVNEQ